MSKIKVDTLEASNQNVRLSHNGTGIVEVKGAGGADGTLKLVSKQSTNAIKIKSPPHSAGQSHTLVLPDNAPTTGTFLKVKSITGSGATAVGQLEYADVPQADLTQLDAANITSGVIPAARFPSTFAATSGAGFKLVNKSVVTSSVGSVEFTLPSTDAKYLIFAKRIQFSNTTTPAIEFLDASDTAMTHNWQYIYDYQEQNNRASNTRSQMYTGADGENFGFIAEFTAGSGYSNLVARAFQCHTTSNKCEYYTFLGPNTNAVAKLRITPQDNQLGANSRTIEPNTEILFYQYVQS